MNWTTLRPIYWTLTLAALAAGAVVALWFTPIEATMGPIQKIFYLHLPAAMSMFLSCALVFVASIGYLWQRTERWDRLGAAAGESAVLWSAVVLLTGTVWGHEAWNVWWTWSPRLTFSLILCALYTGYVLVRGSIQSPTRRALVCAGYGMIAFIDVPLVYLSVRLMPDIHPSESTLEPEMRRTLLLCMAAVFMLAIGIIVARFRHARATTPTLSPVGV